MKIRKEKETSLGSIEKTKIEENEKVVIANLANPINRDEDATVDLASLHRFDGDFIRSKLFVRIAI